MHTLDIFFCIATLFFVVIGIRRGLIGELFRLFALIAGFIVAFFYYPDLSRILNIKNTTIATPLCFSMLYLATALAVIGAGWLIRKVVHLTPLGWFDYLFGGAIGFAKVAIIFWVVCLSCSTFPLAIKRMHLDRSFVFTAYTKLPKSLKFDGIAKFRDSLKKNGNAEIPRSLQNAQQNIERLKSKVDSAKKVDTRKRAR
jgi:uncharacterized membrane protein required for colicin V production